MKVKALKFKMKTNRAHEKITEEKVMELQKAWGESIIAIGEVYTKGGVFFCIHEKQ